MLDALVAVEDGHRQEDRAALVGAEEDGRGLGQRRQQRGHAVAALDPVRLQGVGELGGEVLQLAEVTLRSLPRQSSQIIASRSRACLSHTSVAML